MRKAGCTTFFSTTFFKILAVKKKHSVIIYLVYTEESLQKVDLFPSLGFQYEHLNILISRNVHLRSKHGVTLEVFISNKKFIKIK